MVNLHRTDISTGAHPGPHPRKDAGGRRVRRDPTLGSHPERHTVEDAPQIGKIPLVVLTSQHFDEVWRTLFFALHDLVGESVTCDRVLKSRGRVTGQQVSLYR